MPGQHRLSQACYRRGAALPVAAGLVCLALVASAVPAGAVTTITDIPLPAGQSTPAGIATGHATLFRVDTNCSPENIAPGDGFLWVTCTNLSLVYRISTTGAITRIRLATNQALAGIAQAPNGAMWFTDLPHGLLVRITGS